MRPALPLVLLLLAVVGTLPACAQESRPEQAGAQATAAAGTVVAGAARDFALARASRSRSKGAENAPVTLIEVSDFQCPFRRQFATETLPAVDSLYVDQGKVRMLFINYPLPNHPESWAASEAALCAGAQDAFWPVHDRLFAGQQSWSGTDRPVAHFVEYAAALGLNVEDFRTGVENDWVAPILISDLMQGTQAGISGTPTMILQPTAGGDASATRALSGAQSVEEMRRQIDEVLAASGGN